MAWSEKRHQKGKPVVCRWDVELKKIFQGSVNVFDPFHNSAITNIKHANILFPFTVWC